MNRRERLMLMIAIVMLGGIIFKFLIHDPQQAQYETLIAARDAAQGELDKDERIVARAAQARAEYERVRTYIATVEQKLPQRKEIPALLTAMEQFTHRVGVSFESIHPGTLVAVNAPQTTPASQPAQGAARPRGALPADTHAGKSVPYSSMPVDISLNGTFAQTVQYLKQLRAFPRLVIVDSVALNPSAFPHLGITIKAEIFTLGTPDQASDGQGPQAGQGGH
ncbi:MAG TPA: type 4a pilus biogenesis protein PilO [bacterium]|nr:type 4a pilus biogenesis protein PilO [bacterium]